jgi:hypothetical protein
MPPRPASQIMRTLADAAVLVLEAKKLLEASTKAVYRSRIAVAGSGSKGGSIGRAPEVDEDRRQLG